ncbi:MAG: hypothetical protein KIT09_07645 [Bryobacteraceae bacterium]|nr:hypothetical protein [Bryobacteraceae bacterium]
MLRRDLLKSAGVPMLAHSAHSMAPAAPGGDLGAARIMKSYTAEDHRRRLQNIARCERGIHKCLRRHLITGYIPGQAAYNLAEYPCRKPYDPGEADERELDRLYRGGIRLIHIMEDWNDLLRLFGGDKFTAVNPAGLKRFVSMVHKRRMKILLYASTGYFQYGDPDLKDEWVRGLPGKVGQSAHWRLVRCSPASAGWRAYMLPRTLGILDEYGVDGLYNDWGYRPLYNNANPPTKDEVLAFEETAGHDAALEDLLGLIYSEVKRRGGIYKMHADRNNRPLTRLQLYDYLWVGEGIASSDKVRLETKNHPPYVIPCFDLSRDKLENEDEMYLHTIPYMQFPLLLGGQPFTGERAAIPGVQYLTEEQDWLLRRWRAMWKYYQAHPEGPFAYGHWDSFPPRPKVRETHAHWLSHYLPLVEEGTWAYLEISESDFFRAPLPAEVVASCFANLETYLVLANYGKVAAKVETAASYVSTLAPPGPPRQTWMIAPRSFSILRTSGG